MGLHIGAQATSVSALHAHLCRCCCPVMLPGSAVCLSMRLWPGVSGASAHWSPVAARVLAHLLVHALPLLEDAGAVNRLHSP
jgi:hypothetical protein